MTTLALPSLALLAGALLLAAARHQRARPGIAARLDHAHGTTTIRSAAWSIRIPDPLQRLCDRYQRELRRAGNPKTLNRLLCEKALLGLAAPTVATLPYLAATGTLPSLLAMVVLAVGGFMAPDLLLAREVRQRREAIFLDLPDTITVLALGLRAGQSLRQALELAARDNPGPLGQELQRALTLARTSRQHSDRDALVTIARAAGEPSFARFTELLAVKESPYLDFLHQQAREARAEQNRYLERAADRAYLSMHAPIAPLLAVLVLLFAYGFLRYLAHTT